MPRPRALHGMALAAGAWFALCWFPFGIAPTFPLALLVALRGLRRARRGREALVFALLFGVAEYAVGAHYFYALLRYSALGIVLYLIAIFSILPYAALEFWGAYALERRTGLPRSWGVALLFPLLEWVRTIGDTSFPADLLAHGFGVYPAWLAWTPWIGPFGLCLLAFVTAALLDLALERRARRRPALGIALAAVALWLAPPLTDLVTRSRAASGPELVVGIVQPNVAVADKLDPERRPELWERLTRLTEQAARGADLVVWPETARPGRLRWREGSSPLPDPRMQELADRVGVPILYGCEIARIEEGRVVALYNGAALVHPGGRPGDWYGKQRLLPFVEGIPFADLVGWDPARRRRDPDRRGFLTLVGNFRRGPRPTVFEIGPVRIGVLVCYEGQYPRLGRRYRIAGANALLVITNDAWWGDSVFAAWHAQMVASQARSLGVPVIRAANSGVSSSTGRDGRMSDARTSLFEETTLQVRLAPSTTPPTLFARYGGLVPLALLGLLVGAATTCAVRRRAVAAPRPVE